MLIGQAPGLTEYQTNTAYSGPAGGVARDLFKECGFGKEKFEKHVFTSAVAKCFPGSELKKRKRGEGYRRADLKPSAAMLGNCRPFLIAQLEMVNPRVVVLLGKLALQVYLEVRTGTRPSVSLDSYVGRVVDWGTRRVIPIAHTSGNSFWLNDAGHKALQAEAKRCLTSELSALAL